MKILHRNLSALLLLSLPIPAFATWSIVAVDKKNAQVGAFGATCLYMDPAIGKASDEYQAQPEHLTVMSAQGMLSFESKDQFLQISSEKSTAGEFISHFEAHDPSPVYANDTDDKNTWWDNCDFLGLRQWGVATAHDAAGFTGKGLTDLDAYVKESMAAFQVVIDGETNAVEKEFYQTEMIPALQGFFPTFIGSELVLPVTGHGA